MVVRIASGQDAGGYSATAWHVATAAHLNEVAAAGRIGDGYPVSGDATTRAVARVAELEARAGRVSVFRRRSDSPRYPSAPFARVNGGAA